MSAQVVAARGRDVAHSPSPLRAASPRYRLRSWEGAKWVDWLEVSREVWSACFLSTHCLGHLHE